MGKLSKFLATLVICTSLMFPTGCVFNTVLKPGTQIEMSQEQSQNHKLNYIYSVFNSQWKDYQSMASRGDLTDAQKNIMREKKKILESLKLLIPLYDGSVVAGTPDADQEQQIFDFLNSLNNLNIGG